MCDHYEDLLESTTEEMTDGSSLVIDLYRSGARIETIYNPIGQLVSRMWFGKDSRKWKVHAFHPENGSLASECIFHPDGSLTDHFYAKDGTLILAEDL